MTQAETPRRAANGLYTHCHVCGKELRYGGLSPKVVCSRACYLERRRIERRVTPTSRDCEYCGLGFTPRRCDARFCGAACRQRAHRAAVKVGSGGGGYSRSAVPGPSGRPWAPSPVPAPRAEPL